MTFNYIPKEYLDALKKKETVIGLLIFIATEEGSKDTGPLYRIKDKDIIELYVCSYKSKEGGIISYGELILDNYSGKYNASDFTNLGAGLKVTIYYTFGDVPGCFPGSVLYTDISGFQEEKIAGQSIVRIKLVDMSVILKKLSPKCNFIVNAAICDPNDTEHSILHIITNNFAAYMHCGNIPYRVPYVKLKKNIWGELCEIAKIYGANLSFSDSGSIIFSDSPYELGYKGDDEPSFFLGPDNIIKYRCFSEFYNFSDYIKVRYTHYVKLPRQELWRYNDGSVLYGPNTEVSFPFIDDSREILNNDKYQALYTARDQEGKYKKVVYATDIDTKANFEKNIKTLNNQKFRIIQYDTTSFPDRAIVQLSRDNQNIYLNSAKIEGIPIIAEENQMIIKKDKEPICYMDSYLIKNITSRYFSDDLLNGIPFYEDWANKFFIESKKRKRGVYIATTLGIIHSRVGANITIQLTENGQKEKAKIDKVAYSFKRYKYFKTEFWVTVL